MKLSLEIKKYIQIELPKQNFDSCAVATINFKSGEFDFFEYSLVNKNSFYFDLASLTKPLTLAATYLMRPDIFSKEMILLLNHQAGLPIGGRLDRKSFKEQLLSYKISSSPSQYSDYSALRLQLELEKKGKSLQELSSSFWDKELIHWKHNLGPSPITGVRANSLIQGVVHDDNAFVLGEFCSHAGLFATISGLAQSLLNLDNKYKLLNFMNQAFSKEIDGRFICGWDRVEDQNKTLAGPGASLKTFGHLGFTGTSLWIDVEKEQGYIFLTNATQNFWYQRKGLNKMRRDVGSLVLSR